MQDGASYDGYNLMDAFDYQGVYNVNDSIDAYISGAAKVWVEVNQILSYDQSCSDCWIRMRIIHLMDNLLKLVRVSLILKIMFCL